MSIETDWLSTKTYGAREIRERFFNQGKYAEAIPHLLDSARQYSDVDFPWMLGKAYFEIGEHNKSISAFHSALHTCDASLYDGIRIDIYRDMIPVLDYMSYYEALDLCTGIVATMELNPDPSLLQEVDFEYSDLQRNLEGQVTAVLSQALADRPKYEL